MIIKRTIKFSIRYYRKSDNRVRMRVSYVGNRLDFQTGIFIKKESWDNVQQRVLPINSSIAIANDLNVHLFKMLSDMVIVFREFELRQIIPSPKELREKFQKQSAPQGRPMAESTLSLQQET